MTESKGLPILEACCANNKFGNSYYLIWGRWKGIPTRNNNKHNLDIGVEYKEEKL